MTDDFHERGWQVYVEHVEFCTNCGKPISNHDMRAHIDLLQQERLPVPLPPMCFDCTDQYLRVNAETVAESLGPEFVKLQAFMNDLFDQLTDDREAFDDENQ